MKRVWGLTNAPRVSREGTPATTTTTTSRDEDTRRHTLPPQEHMTRNPPNTNTTHMHTNPK
ncbi:hypothetical protein E2C01_084135 [Portunus trituberculatus]|uniref:Uncharacterized protein n=1 Tax=Portunus trituberculatus TaxID=210409 RepID=A0A5B7J3H1_PORTR|nr:hypothetical protein [Portunus trituberculatus]